MGYLVPKVIPLRAVELPLLHQHAELFDLLLDGLRLLAELVLLGRDLLLHLHLVPFPVAESSRRVAVRFPLLGLAGRAGFQVYKARDLPRRDVRL
jgi:hypothetical protein